MTLSEPKVLTFWIAVALAVLGVLSTVVAIPFVSANAFWVVVLGFVLLALGNMVKGL